MSKIAFPWCPNKCLKNSRNFDESSKGKHPAWFNAYLVPNYHIFFRCLVSILPPKEKHATWSYCKAKQPAQGSILSNLSLLSLQKTLARLHLPIPCVHVCCDRLNECVHVLLGHWLPIWQIFKGKNSFQVPYVLCQDLVAFLELGHLVLQGIFLDQSTTLFEKLLDCILGFFKQRTILLGDSASVQRFVIGLKVFFLH